MSRPSPGRLTTAGSIPDGAGGGEMGVEAVRRRTGRGTRLAASTAPRSSRGSRATGAMVTAGAGAWAAITASISAAVTRGDVAGNLQQGAGVPFGESACREFDRRGVWPRFSGSIRHSVPYRRASVTASGSRVTSTIPASEATPERASSTSSSMARNSAVRAGWSRIPARRCFAPPRSFTGTTAWTPVTGHRRAISGRSAHARQGVRGTVRPRSVRISSRAGISTRRRITANCLDDGTASLPRTSAHEGATQDTIFAGSVRAPRPARCSRRRSRGGPGIRHDVHGAAPAADPASGVSMAPQAFTRAMRSAMTGSGSSRIARYCG